MRPTHTCTTKRGVMQKRDKTVKPSISKYNRDYLEAIILDLCRDQGTNSSNKKPLSEDALIMAIKCLIDISYDRNVLDDWTSQHAVLHPIRYEDPQKDVSYSSPQSPYVSFLRIDANKLNYSYSFASRNPYINTQGVQDTLFVIIRGTDIRKQKTTEDIGFKKDVWNKVWSKEMTTGARNLLLYAGSSVVSADLQDWLTNLKAGSDSGFHSGFYLNATNVVDQISKFIYDNPTVTNHNIVFVGHSMGAATATIASFLYNQQYTINGKGKRKASKLLVASCPPCFDKNENLIKEFQRTVPDHKHMWSVGDIVVGASLSHTHPFDEKNTLKLCTKFGLDYSGAMASVLKGLFTTAIFATTSAFALGPMGVGLAAGVAAVKGNKWMYASRSLQSMMEFTTFMHSLYEIDISSKRIDMYDLSKNDTGQYSIGSWDVSAPNATQYRYGTEYCIGESKGNDHEFQVMCTPGGESSETLTKFMKLLETAAQKTLIGTAANVLTKKVGEAVSTGTSKYKNTIITNVSSMEGIGAKTVWMASKTATAVTVPVALTLISNVLEKMVTGANVTQAQARRTRLEEENPLGELPSNGPSILKWWLERYDDEDDSDNEDNNVAQVGGGKNSKQKDMQALKEQISGLPETMQVMALTLMQVYSNKQMHSLFPWDIMSVALCSYTTALAKELCVVLNVRDPVGAQCLWDVAHMYVLNEVTTFNTHDYVIQKDYEMDKLLIKIGSQLQHKTRNSTQVKQSRTSLASNNTTNAKANSKAKAQAKAQVNAQVKAPQARPKAKYGYVPNVELSSQSQAQVKKYIQTMKNPSSENIRFARYMKKQLNAVSEQGKQSLEATKVTPVQNIGRRTQVQVSTGGAAAKQTKQKKTNK